MLATLFILSNNSKSQDDLKYYYYLLYILTNADFNIIDIAIKDNSKDSGADSFSCELYLSHTLPLLGNQWILLYIFPRACDFTDY